MPLDDELTTALRMMTPEGAPPLDSVPLAAVRAGIQAQVEQLKAARAAGLVPAARAVSEVQDRAIEGPGGALPLRVYRPDHTGPQTPLLVYMHGGGFVLCNPDTHDDPCRDLCAELGAVVVSVDYRLAPEHPFPAALDDCMAAIHWATAQAASLGAQASRLALVGDSAGANLSIATALRLAAEQGPRPRVVGALYPAADLRMPSRYASTHENGQGNYGLSERDMAYFSRLYLSRPEDAEHPWVSPLLSTQLQQLPGCVLATAQYDPLRDEGQALAACIEQAGGDVEAVCYDGLPHGFFNMAGVSSRAAVACADFRLRLQRRLAH